MDVTILVSTVTAAYVAVRDLWILFRKYKTGRDINISTKGGILK